MNNNKYNINIITGSKNKRSGRKKLRIPGKIKFRLGSYAVGSREAS